MSINKLRRVGFKLYKIGGWVSIIFAFSLITLRLITPYFAPSGSQLIQLAKDNFPYELNIASAELKFIGWDPAITLYNVDVLSDAHQLALKIEEVNIVANIYALLFKKIELNNIVIKGMKVGIEYQSDGSIAISDLSFLKWRSKQSSSKRLPIKHLLVKDSDIHLILGPGKSLPLAQVDLQMDSGLQLRMSGQALVANDVPSAVQFTLDFPLFSNHAAEFFCQWKDADLGQLSPLLGDQLPIVPTAGKLNLKAWLSVDKLGKKDLIAEVEVSDGELKSKQKTMSFPAFTGWVKALGEGDNWNTQSQWQPHNNIIPYEFIINTYSCPQGKCIDLQTTDINIQSTLQSLYKFDCVPSNLITLLENYQVNGQIDTLEIKWLQNQWKLLPYETELSFSNLSLKEASGVELSSLEGALRYEEGKIRALIQGPSIHFAYPKWFTKPLNTKNVKLWLTFSPSDEMNLEGVLSNATLDETSISGEFSLNIVNRKINDLELSIEADEWPIRHALEILPKKIMDQSLVKWLEQALVDGTIKHSTFLFRGNPEDFPFDRNEGVFEANLALDNVLLDYAKDDWPTLSQLDASLLFKNRRMEVDAKSAVLEQGPLLSTKAVIPDLSASIATLSVDAKLQNQLDRAASIIQKSPLKNTLGQSLSALNFEGNLELNLGLMIPLSKKSLEPVKVSGLMSVSDATVKVLAWDLNAEHVNGVVSFTENSVSSNNLKGKMLNQSADFDISTNKHDSESEIVIQANGHLKYNDLQQWLQLPSYDFISGETDYHARVAVFSDTEKHPIHLEVTAPLTDIEVKAPNPFGKEINTAKESSLILDLIPNHSTHAHVKYGMDTNLAIVMDYHDDKWHFKGGHLNFGNNPSAKIREDRILLIDGTLEELNIKSWKSLLGGSSSSSLTIEPLVAVKIGKLDLYGETFSKTKVEAEWDKIASTWNFNFDGPSIKGHITLPEGEDQREISIDLSKLALTRGSEEAAVWGDSKAVLQRPIEVKVKKLKLNNKSITDFQARIEPSWKGYDFPRIQAKMKGTELTLSGQWDVLAHIKQVTAEGKLTTRNSTDTFKAIGIDGTVHQAKGTIDFSLGWHGTPAKIDYPTLSGKASFQLNNGYVQGVDPGIGRVLNLLSLDSVQRRLNLDFNDITKKGLAFDEFTGKFQFGRGKVSSNKVSLKGPSANIEGYGQADLENQDISGELVVMPNVTGSLPVAAAIAAGNPAVGAAVWVVDKMVGKKLQEIHRYRYRLVGTWDSPKLEELPAIPIRRG